MITQKIQFNLMQNKLDDIRIVQGDTLRELQFECLDMDGEALSTEDYTYTYAQVKPDHTFIVETLTDGILQVFDQMWAITGTSYYALQIQDNNTEELVYSGQGALIVDDALISMDDMESVAEVNGYVFPTDFCTQDQVADICDSLGYAKINDLLTTTGNVWSAMHTLVMIDNQVEDLIADNTSQSLTKTWSNKKIQDEIEGMIDDDNSSEYTTYSSDKIDDLIAGAGSSSTYSTTPQKVATWIDGSNVYEVVMEFTPAHALLSGNWDDIYNNPIPSGAKIIDTKYVGSGGAGSGWTSYTGETYQPDSTNNYITIYGTCGNGISVGAIIWRYIMPA